MRQRTEAAFYAFTNPHCRVTGIDLSETSLQHHMYLKERHALSNLSLRQMNLLDVASLGQAFDYVVSTGVLHHLPDPDEGLRTLGSVLQTNGVMSVMVYGRYNRAGVYMLKDVFRRAGLQQDARSLEIIKATLAALPPWHHARSYLGTAADLSYDSGLVDTFLHPVDRPYSVPEILPFVQRSGLSFQGWLDPGFYALQEALPSTHPLRVRASALPPEEQWAVVELVSQSISCHRFLVCHPERATNDYRPDFASEAALTYKPALAYRGHLDAAGTLHRQGRKAQLTPMEAAWLRRADGKTPIVELLAGSKPGKGVAMRFFSDMWERGHLVFELG